MQMGAVIKRDTRVVQVDPPSNRLFDGRFRAEKPFDVAAAERSASGRCRPRALLNGPRQESRLESPF